MKHIHTSGAALILVVTTSAWAGGGAYPPITDMVGASPVTRAQVIAEMQESQRLGLAASGEGAVPIATTAQQQMIAAAGERAAGHSSATPQLAGTPADSAAMTADQRSARVHAELAEAQRLGLMNFGDEGPHITTADQEAMVTAAGQRAVDQLRVAGTSLR